MVQKSKIVTFILSWFLGWLGIHRFYTGKVWTGIIYLLTGGLWGVGTFFDNVFILLNCYKDKQGNLLKNDFPTSILVILWIVFVVIGLVIGLLTGAFELVFGLIGGLFGLV